jgi:uncharacterized protein (TIGR03000 family)
MRRLIACATFALGGYFIASPVAHAQEPILHPPRKSAAGEEVFVPRWSPAATDFRYLLWNDWAPAFYPGVYSPGWGGWWYMYFGHTYSPFFTPHLHDYPYHHYTHPYFNYPLESPWGDYVIVVQKPTPAKVVVSLPEDAKLTVNGQPTELTSDQRVFTTPELKPGKDYYYVIRAEVVRDGEVKSLTKEVAVTAGRESKVEFALPAAATVRK